MNGQSDDIHVSIGQWIAIAVVGWLVVLAGATGRALATTNVHRS